jgi:hypothetical protein
MAVPGLDPGIVTAIHAVRRIQRPQVSEGARNLCIRRLLQRAASMLAPSLLRRGVDGRDEMLWGLAAAKLVILTAVNT